MSQHDHSDGEPDAQHASERAASRADADPDARAGGGAGDRPEMRSDGGADERPAADVRADGGAEVQAGDGDVDSAADASGQDASAGDEPLDWDTAADAFRRQLEERRTVGVEVPDEGVAEFTLRGLTREERDDVEQSAASVQQTGRGEPEVEVDTGVIRRKMLEYGIVEGPEGFDPSRADHVDALPPGVQDDLVDIIEEMSSLTVEERDGFQKVGGG